MAAKKTDTKNNAPNPARRHRTTSIGRGPNSRPKNKHKTSKKYRGQGG